MYIYIYIYICTHAYTFIHVRSLGSETRGMKAPVCVHRLLRIAESWWKTFARLELISRMGIWLQLHRLYFQKNPMFWKYIARGVKFNALFENPCFCLIYIYIYIYLFIHSWWNDDQIPTWVSAFSSAGSPAWLSDALRKQNSGQEFQATCTTINYK